MIRASTIAAMSLAALLVCRPAIAEPITNTIPYLARPLPLSAVRLTGGPLKRAQDLDAEYLLKLEPDRMLFGLRQQAGLAPKAQQAYGGWDAIRGKQLTGHIVGHYLSAISYMFAATGEARFKERVDYIVTELKEIQEKQGDGYLGAITDAQGKSGKELLHDVGEGSIRAGAFDLNGLWSPWYVEHKIFAGLRDAYRLTGNRTALDVEIKFAGWSDSILSKLDDAQIQRMLGTEFGGMNEVLLDLYADTGDKRWLKTSDYFYHRAIVEPLANHQDILGGKHGNTLVPKMLGELSRYIYIGNETSGRSARFFWDQVVDHHSFATGGHGYDEYFGPPDQISGQVTGTAQRSPDLRTAESCNVYNMLKMTRVLFALQPDDRYAEFHERALFNHVLGSMDPEDGRVCYMVPVGQGVTHEYQNMQQSFTCCVGSGMESHALHGDGIYYESGDKLWVNIYAPSTAEWKNAGASLSMETDFPEGQSATLKLTMASPKQLTLALRRPAWAGEGFSVKVNGEAISQLPKAGSYVELIRIWKTGDTVSLVLPKTLRIEPTPDDPKLVALMWGPLVLGGDLGPEVRGGRGRRGGEGATSRPSAPAFAAGVPVESWLKSSSDKPGNFHAAGVGGEVDLVPFYRLHRRTYSLYWNLVSP